MKVKFNLVTKIGWSKSNHRKIWNFSTGIILYLLITSIGYLPYWLPTQEASESLTKFGGEKLTDFCMEFSPYKNSKMYLGFLILPKV